MLNITTLSRPRAFAFAAALALAAALPGAGLVSSAHAAPAIPPTTLATTVTGPSGTASGGQAAYVVTLKNTGGATATNPIIGIVFTAADVALGTISAPGTTCSTIVVAPKALVECTRPALAVGATLTLTVNVTFTGANGIENVLGGGEADNAPFVSQTLQTAVAAQEVVPAQNPGYQAPYSGSAYGGGQG